MNFYEIKNISIDKFRYSEKNKMHLGQHFKLHACGRVCISIHTGNIKFVKKGL